MSDAAALVSERLGHVEIAMRVSHSPTRSSHLRRLGLVACWLAGAVGWAAAADAPASRDVAGLIQPMDIDYETDRADLNALQAGIAPFLPSPAGAAATAATAAPATAPATTISAADPAVIDLATSLIEVGSTTNYGVEAGEPTQGGKLQRTAWWAMRPLHDGVLAFIDREPRRLSFHPVINIYEGAPFASLRRMATSSDVRAQRGDILTVSSADVRKGRIYWVQVGERSASPIDAGWGTSYAISRALLPPGGGLVVTPYQSGFPAYCADVAPGNRCPKAFFDVVSFLKTTAVITGEATGVGGAYASAEQPFTLTARAAARLIFWGASNADTSRPVAYGGAFRFTATAGGAVVARAHASAIATLGVFTQKSTLSVSTLPTLTTAPSGNYAPALVKVANTGRHSLSGCRFGVTSFYNADGLRWAPVNEAGTGLAASLDAPISLKPGQTKTFGVALQREAVADAAFNHSLPLYYFKCPNAESTAMVVDTDLDVSNVDPNQPARVAVSLDASDPFAVPARGVVIQASALNGGESATTTATIRYVPPTHEFDATQQFSVAICPSSQGDVACLKSTKTTLALSAPQGAAVAFKIAIHPPTGVLKAANVRRIVDVTLRQDDVPGVGPMLIGGQTLDVSKK